MRVFIFSSILTSLLWLYAATAMAYDIEEQRLFGKPDATTSLKIISTADTDLFAPLLTSFLEKESNTIIEYTTVSSTELMRAIATENAAFDVAISSAMDLQTKLANDGFSQAHNTDLSRRIPAWGKWRNHVFTFTQEPATIVYSPDALSGLEVPLTRQALITLLRNNEDKFRGRVGTYDVRSSGLGYLFATHDARNSDIYWRLSEVMGSLDAQLYCCSGKMIEDIEQGKIAIAYNVLGSYAQARKSKGARIEILEPQDFTTLMQRSALIPVNAPMPALAGRFIDHLLSASWLSSNVEYYPFPAIRQKLQNEETPYRPIRLGPGLLVFLDDLKRRKFLREWEASIIQE